MVFFLAPVAVAGYAWYKQQQEQQLQQEQQQQQQQQQQAEVDVEEDKEQASYDNDVINNDCNKNDEHQDVPGILAASSSQSTAAVLDESFDETTKTDETAFLTPNTSFDHQDDQQISDEDQVQKERNRQHQQQQQKLKLNNDNNHYRRQQAHSLSENHDNKSNNSDIGCVDEGSSANTTSLPTLSSVQARRRQEEQRRRQQKQQRGQSSPLSSSSLLSLQNASMRATEPSASETTAKATFSSMWTNMVQRYEDEMARRQLEDQKEQEALQRMIQIEQRRHSRHHMHHFNNVSSHDSDGDSNTAGLVHGHDGDDLSLSQSISPKSSTSTNNW